VSVGGPTVTRVTCPPRIEEGDRGTRLILRHLTFVTGVTIMSPARHRAQRDGAHPGDHSSLWSLTLVRSSEP
jgi:hypothetical protein